MAIKMYGILSCEKIRKFFSLFEEYEIEFEFIDLKKNPPTVEKIEEWEAFLGELPINRRGTTYKDFKKKFESAERAEKIKMMQQNVPCIERPILERDGEVIAVGGRPERLFVDLF